MDRDDFIGRDADMARVAGLLAGPARLVTIVGAPGLGKTRLALELARQRAALVVRLADARTVDDVLAAVGTALDVAPAAAGRDAMAARVARAIAARGAQLIVLDNFEQLTELAPDTIGRWLADAPEGRFLVTSREVLHLDGEWRHEVAPLSLNGDGATEPDAVRLLRARIVRARGGQPVIDEPAALIEIAGRVDGIPLALELAAQRIAVFGAQLVIARLASYLDFLADDRREADPARRTLRSTIAWSFDLLLPHERAALAQCAVFPGAFDAEAAERVVTLGEPADGGDPGPAGVLATLQALRDKSLLVCDAQASARFRLLLPIRELALEQLAGSDAERAHDRHAAYMLERAERRARELPELSLLAALERDRDDLFAILARARQADSRDTLRRAVRAIAPLILARGPMPPLLDALEAAIDPAPDPAPGGAADGAGAPGTAVDLLILRARLLRRVGRIAEAEALFAAALDRGLAPAPYLHGEIAYCRFSAGRIADAVTGWSHARAIRATACPQDVRGECGDLVHMAFAFRELGRFDEAEALAAEARSIAGRRGDAGAESTALTILAVVACDRGATARGLRLGREAVELARTTTSSFFEGIALTAVAMAHQLDENLADAAALLEPSHVHLAAVGLCRLDAGAVMALGILAWEQGELGVARVRLEDALALDRAIGDARYAAYTSAALAAIDADEGHLAAAARRLAELPPPDGLPLSRAIAVHRLHLPLAEARAADAAGQPEVAERLRAEVRRVLDEPANAYEWRIARRLCASVLEHGAATLVVSDGGAMCVVGETALDLARRGPARALLVALAEQRLAHPGQPVSWTELVAVGWPAERMLPHAARNRVKVTIAWLRRSGLRELIQSDDRGYWLRRGTRVVFPADDRAPQVAS